MSSERYEQAQRLLADRLARMDIAGMRTALEAPIVVALALQDGSDALRTRLTRDFAPIAAEILTELRALGVMR